MDKTQEILGQAECLYDATARQVYGMALYMTGDSSSAKEIAAAAFCKAFYSNRDKEDVDLFRIRAMAKIYRYCKKRDADTKKSALERRQPEICDDRKLYAAHILRQLCPQDRFIVLAFCWQRYSVEQISKMIWLPAALTRKRLNYALCRAPAFLSALKESCDTYE